MISVPIYNLAGEKVGDREIDETLFGVDAESGPNVSLLKQAIVMYQGNQRQGTHRTLARGEVAGSTRKLYRQKGTGRARAGSVRSPTRRGGGHAHQKLPRSFRSDMPQSARRRATDEALFAKLRDGNILIIEDHKLEAPKTRAISGFLAALKLEGVTFAPSQPDQVLWKSSRNIPKTMVVPVSDLNALQVLERRHVVFTVSGFDKLVETRSTSRQSA